MNFSFKMVRKIKSIMNKLPIKKFPTEYQNAKIRTEIEANQKRVQEIKNAIFDLAKTAVSLQSCKSVPSQVKARQTQEKILKYVEEFRILINRIKSLHEEDMGNFLIHFSKFVDLGEIDAILPVSASDVVSSQYDVEIINNMIKNIDLNNRVKNIKVSTTPVVTEMGRRTTFGKEYDSLMQNSMGEIKNGIAHIAERNNVSFNIINNIINIHECSTLQSAKSLGKPTNNPREKYDLFSMCANNDEKIAGLEYNINNIYNRDESGSYPFYLIKDKQLIVFLRLNMARKYSWLYWSLMKEDRFADALMVLQFSDINELEGNGGFQNDLNNAEDTLFEKYKTHLNIRDVVIQ